MGFGVPWVWDDRQNATTNSMLFVQMFASAERQGADASVVYAAAWCRRTSPGWVMVNLDGGGKMFLHPRTPKFQLTARQP